MNRPVTPRPAGADVESMCGLADAIQNDARSAQILLNAAISQLDSMPELPREVESILEAVRCFTACALQNADLIHDQAIELRAAGGRL